MLCIIYRSLPCGYALEDYCGLKLCIVIHLFPCDALKASVAVVDCRLSNLGAVLVTFLFAPSNIVTAKNCDLCCTKLPYKTFLLVFYAVLL